MRNTKVHLQLLEDRPLGYIISDPYLLSYGRVCDLNMDLLTCSCKWDSAQSTMAVTDTCVRLVDETTAGDNVG